MNFTIQLLKLAHVFWTSVLEKPATKNCYFLNLRSQLLTNFEYERILMNRKYIYAKPWSTMLQWHERMVITHMRALIWTCRSASMREQKWVKYQALNKSKQRNWREKTKYATGEFNEEFGKCIYFLRDSSFLFTHSWRKAAKICVLAVAIVNIHLWIDINTTFIQ